MDSYERLMNKGQEISKMVDDKVKEITGEDIGFILLIYPGKSCVHLTTETDRTRVIAALREVANKMEERHRKSLS